MNLGCSKRLLLLHCSCANKTCNNYYKYKINLRQILYSSSSTATTTSADKTYKLLTLSNLLYHYPTLNPKSSIIINISSITTSSLSSCSGVQKSFYSSSSSSSSSQALSSIISRDDFEALIRKKKKIVLFINCKSSAEQVLQILQLHGVNNNNAAANVDVVDVMWNESSVAQGVIEYSGWPTFPQLFINGSFIGGLELIQQMHANGSLNKQLQSIGFNSRHLVVTDHTTTISSSSQTIDDKAKSSSKWMKKSRQFLATENIWTIPNLLSTTRLGISPLIGYFVITAQYGPALGLFAFAGITDLLDGWIARGIPGQSSTLGSFLDPMADKVLVGILFVSLTYSGLIPLLLTCLIISRDIVLIVAASVIRYQSLEPPRTLSRYFNISAPTAQLAPTTISKVNTGVQLGLVTATLTSAAAVIPYDLESWLVWLWYLTGATTIGSAISYLVVKNTYKFLQHTPSTPSRRANEFRVRARKLHKSSLFHDKDKKNGSSKF